MLTASVYDAHMSSQQVLAWVCDVCGHTWIASELVPTHCASSKCRSRRWDSDAATKPKPNAKRPPQRVIDTSEEYL